MTNDLKTFLIVLKNGTSFRVQADLLTTTESGQSALMYKTSNASNAYVCIIPKSAFVGIDSAIQNPKP